MRFDGKKLPTYDGLERAFNGFDKRYEEAVMAIDIQRIARLGRCYRRLCLVWKAFHDEARIP